MLLIVMTLSEETGRWTVNGKAEDTNDAKETMAKITDLVSPQSPGCIESPKLSVFSTVEIVRRVVKDLSPWGFTRLAHSGTNIIGFRSRKTTSQTSWEL